MAAPGGEAGIDLQAPSPSKVHPWYGQRTQSPSTVPSAREPPRCTHRLLSATMRPSLFLRKSASSCPSTVMRFGVAPMERASSTAYQKFFNIFCYFQVTSWTLGEPPKPVTVIL